MNKFKFIAEEQLQAPLITELPWPESEIGRRIKIMKGEHANVPARVVRIDNKDREFKFELEVLYSEIMYHENETCYMNDEEYQEALYHNERLNR